MIDIDTLNNRNEELKACINISNDRGGLFKGKPKGYEDWANETGNSTKIRPWTV